MAFPDYIQRRLDAPPPGAPGRHEALAKLSYQMVGEHIPDDQIFYELRAWMPDRDKTNKEIWDLIRGAHRRNPQPATATSATPVYRARETREVKQATPKFKPTGERREMPSGVDQSDPIAFLKNVYGSEAHICITKADHDGKLNLNETRKVVEFERKYKGSDFFSEQNGVYYCINPLNNDAVQRTDKNVADYRFLLIELEIPKDQRNKYSEDEQHNLCNEYYTALVDSKLPLKAIYTSGGPSVHGLVEVGAKSEAEWRRRMEETYEFCATMPGFDQSNKNLARLSRLPGAMRGERMQELLLLIDKPEDWQHWRNSIEPRAFEVSDLAKLLTEKPELPPILVDGWLHKTSIGMLTGSMKTNKSWTLMELAIKLAIGGDWLGRECAEATVMYFDAEIQRAFWHDRFVNLCNGLGIKPMDVAITGRIKPVFIAAKDVSIASLYQELIRMKSRDELKGIEVIILDPIYQLYEDDWEENANEDMAKLGRYLRFIAEDCGVSVVFAHHHAKGNMEGRRDIEKASGGGAFGRFVASSLAITYTGDGTKNEYTLGWTTSHFKQEKPIQIATRNGFQWVVDDVASTEERAEQDANQLLSIFPESGVSRDDLETSSGLSARRFKRALSDLKDQGFIIYNAVQKGGVGDGLWHLTDRGINYKSSLA